MEWNNSRFEIVKEFNTKDIIIYDNETNHNVCRCDTEDEAKRHIKWMCKNHKFYKTDEI